MPPKVQIMCRGPNRLFIVFLPAVPAQSGKLALAMPFDGDFQFLTIEHKDEMRDWARGITHPLSHPLRLARSGSLDP